MSSFNVIKRLPLSGRPWVIFIVLAILIVAAMLWESPQNPLGVFPIQQTSEKQRPSNVPALIVEGARARLYGDDGLLSYTLDAKGLEHYRFDNTARDHVVLAAPHVTLHGDQAPWHIRSTHGKIENEWDLVTLWDDVTVSQPLTKPSRGNAASTIPTELSTSQLTIRARENAVHTSEKVRIRSFFGETTATGMTADFSTKSIKLLSNVRGLHTVQPKRVNTRSPNQ